MVVPRSDYIRIPIPKDTCRMILFAFPIAVLDLLLWVVVVFILAGPLLVGGIYESIVDRRLLKLLDDGATNNQARKMLLVVILLGNIAYREGDVLKDVEDFIFRAPGTQAKMNLKSLLDCQAAFGVTSTCGIHALTCKNLTFLASRWSGDILYRRSFVRYS